MIKVHIRLKQTLCSMGFAISIKRDSRQKLKNIEIFFNKKNLLNLIG